MIVSRARAEGLDDRGNDSVKLWLASRQSETPAQRGQ